MIRAADEYVPIEGGSLVANALKMCLSLTTGQRDRRSGRTDFDLCLIANRRSVDWLAAHDPAGLEALKAYAAVRRRGFNEAAKLRGKG